MASFLVRRVLSSSLQRPQFLGAARRAFPAVISLRTKASAADSIPTDAEQATGLEKKEFDAIVTGVEDPFKLEMAHGPPGTRENPTVVPTMFDERIVGCVCDDETTVINWMMLKPGPPQRCDCGNFYVLKQQTNPLNVDLGN